MKERNDRALLKRCEAKYPDFDYIRAGVLIEAFAVVTGCSPATANLRRLASFRTKDLVCAACSDGSLDHNALGPGAFRCYQKAHNQLIVCV